MDRLDELLAESTPRLSPISTLDALTSRVTAPRRRRGLIVAGILALSLAGGTAATAAAGNGPLDEVVDYYLSGDRAEHNDHAWEMDITGTDGTMHCVGGIVVFPSDERPEYVEAEYLAIKEWVRKHDWSDLEPDPSLLNHGQWASAEALGVTADRHMMVEAEEAGFDLRSVMTRGTATCTPK